MHQSSSIYYQEGKISDAGKKNRKKKHKHTDKHKNEMKCIEMVGYKPYDFVDGWKKES